MTDDHSKLIRDLNDLGFPIHRVSDLYNQKYNYKSAVPRLIAALEEDEEKAHREEIVRSISVRWAKPKAAKPLIEAFLHANDERELGIRWVIGNALAVVADDSVFDDLVRLLRDRNYGRSREMLALALSGMKDSRADAVLISLLQDEVLAGHALMAINKRGMKLDSSLLEKLRNDPRAWVRKEAEKNPRKVNSKN